MRGGRVGLASDLTRVFDDIQALHPTVIGSTPRLYHVLYSRFSQALASTVCTTPETVQGAIALHNARRELVQQARESWLGARLKHLIVGGAQVSHVVKLFLAEVWGVVE